MPSYFNTLYAGLEDQTIAVWHKKTRTTRFFMVNDLDQVEAYMISQAANDDVYFGWCTQPTSLPSGRGSNNTAISLPGFMMDIDIRSPDAGVHSNNEHLPTCHTEVITYITEELGLPHPTAIRLSGNGAYFDWQTVKPLTFTNDNDREVAKRLSSDLQKLIIRGSAKAKGWKLDNTSDLARVTRCPGTLNHKTDPAKPVTLLSYDADLRVSPEALRAAIDAANQRLGHGSTAAAAKPKPRLSKSRAGAADTSQVERLPNYEAVQAGCDWARYLEENKDTLPEPMWYAGASIIGRCENGRKLFHDLSCTDSRYDVAETDKKLDHALQYGPRTCDNIRSTLEHGGCERCPFYTIITSPIALGYRHPDNTAIMGTYVFDLSTNTYISLLTFQRYDARTMTNKFAHLIPGTHNALVHDEYLRKVDGTDYRPGVPDLFMETEGKTLLNLWSPGDLAAEPGECSHILQHLDYLFAPEERDHILDVLAHTVQHPEKKVRHVLLLGGRQGTGKSFLGELAKRLFGNQNVRTVQAATLASRWTADLCNVQICVAEELAVHERREAYETMKQLITQDHIFVEQKNLPLYEARTPRLIIAMTNHIKSISLPADDRRFYVAHSMAERRDMTYYNALFVQGLSEATAFLHLLSSRDLTHFNPNNDPPRTQAKDMLVKHSRAPLTQIISQLIEDEEPPFERDVVTRSDAFRGLAHHYSDYRLSEASVSNSFVELELDRLPQIRLTNGTKVRPWIVRNSAKWIGATAEELGAAIRAPLN